MKTDQSALSPAQRALLGLLNNALFGGSVDLPDEMEAVFSEASAQAVLPIAWDAAAKVLSSEQKARFADRNALTMKYIQNNMAVIDAHTRLHRLMKLNGVDYCILKGTASAYYYPNPFLRTMGDVDFLIPRHCIPQVTRLLEADGFTPWDEDHICHVAFRKENRHLEMHFDLPGMPEGEAGEILRSYIEDIFETSETVGEFPFCKPSHFHHGLILLLHTYHHMLSEGIGLRHLCDLAVFFNTFTEEDFRQLFYDKLSAVGLWKFAQIMAQTCQICLGLPHRDWMGTPDEEICFALIRDVFSGGNFGRKDQQRELQGVAISNRGKDGVGHSPLQFFKTLNRLAEPHWEIVRKNRFLHAFGWIPMGFRYLGSVLRGRRKLPDLQTLRGMEQRKQLYAQFELFEDIKKASGNRDQGSGNRH